jgi:hypothetical protein
VLGAGRWWGQLSSWLELALSRRRVEWTSPQARLVWRSVLLVVRRRA